MLRKPKILYGVDIIDTNLDAVKIVFNKVRYKRISTFLDWPEDKFDVVGDWIINQIANYSHYLSLREN